MMKEKLARFARDFAAGVRNALNLHPVELSLVLFGCVSCLFWYGGGWEDEKMSFLRLVPLFVLLALAVNLFAGRGPWRKLYWVCWVPLVPLSLWSGIDAWVQSLPFLITLCVLVPLALLMARRAADNHRFVADALVYVRSAILAFFFANVILGLFAAILFSTASIFGIEGEWTERVWIYSLILTETLLVPVFLLVMIDRWSGGIGGSTRLLDVLLNWIVTPALLIYLGILWLYILKIVVAWTLPDGGVAYMVFGFTIFALLVKALQETLDRRMYHWFFDRFSFYALPAVVLFWVGALRRVNEYGLTEPRVWLLLCGGLMTLCLLLFLSRRTGRYLWVSLAAFVSFAVVTFIPTLEPDRIAVRSQAERAVRIARSLGRLTPDGALILIPVPTADTARRAEYRRLYEALEYIEYRDRDRFAAFGLEETDDLLAQLPDGRFREYVKWGNADLFSGGRDDSRRWSVEAPADWRIETRGFGSAYTNIRRYGGPDGGYDFSDDTLRIRLGHSEPLWVLSGRELLETQLAKAGCTLDELGTAPDSTQRMRFLDYKCTTVRILFDNIWLETSEDGTRIDDVSIGLVLTR